MTNLESLQDLLLHTPVVAELNPLVPLCLEPGVRIVDDVIGYLSELDSHSVCRVEKVIITRRHPLLLERFPFLKFHEPPSALDINRNMHYHLGYARDNLLSSRKLADLIEKDASKHSFNTIILILIDGLGYQDIANWGSNVEPCFVDGPSITFGEDAEEKEVLEEVGFPAIINNPTVFSRLQKQGYRIARGFTYWRAENNRVSDTIFRGIPATKVENFNMIIKKLENHNFSERTYIQIIRQGLDGLAHNRRELDREEIESDLLAIRKDIEQLLDILKRKEQKTCLYMTSDHGVLWKNDHPWILLELPRCHHRYTTRILAESEKEYAVQVACGKTTYNLFRYPYLANKIPVNDCGVHGGLSYQESFVPFARFEV